MSIRRGAFHGALGISAVALAVVAFLWFIWGDLAADPDEPVYSHLGCQFETDSISPISYRFFSVNSDTENAFSDGVEDWNDTDAPGHFSEKSSSLDPQINVTDDDLFDEVYAEMAYSCPNGTFSGDEVSIRFNTEYTLTNAQKRVIARHELGHSYGLDHVTPSCHTMTVPILWTCSGSRPSDDDVYGVDTLY